MLLISHERNLRHKFTGVAEDDSVNTITRNIKQKRVQIQKRLSLCEKRAYVTSTGFLGSTVHIKTLDSHNKHIERLTVTIIQHHDLFASIGGQLLSIAGSSSPDIAQFCRVKKFASTNSIY